MSIMDETIIEKLTERVVNRIDSANNYILKEIARCINDVGSLTPSKSAQLAQLLKYGGNYNKITEKLAEMTNLAITDIQKIFEELAKQNYLFAKKFYDYRGIDYIPFDENIALQKQIKTLTNMAIKDFINLSRTTAMGFKVKDEKGNVIFKGIKKAYTDAIDDAIVNVGQGKDTIQNQIRKICNELGSSGLKTIEYESGYTRRLDSAIRLNIQGALRDMSIQLQEDFGTEFDADGVEISVHKNSAPDHQDIQGHQFTNEEFKKMQTGKSFKDVNGKKYNSIKRAIGKWNCYHYVFSIVISVDDPQYNSKELNELIKNNEKGFDFDGKHYTNYEGTQLQRRIETQIRKERDVLTMLKMTNDTEAQKAQNKKINMLANKYNRLSKESGLKTKMERLKS